MDWTLKANMVSGLFLCAALTSRRRGHTPFVYAGAEAFHTGARRLSRTQAVLGRVIPRGWVPMSGIKYGVSKGSPTTPHSIDDPPRTPHF